MPQCQFPVFCCFCVSEKLHRKYFQNWTKQVQELLFFPDEGRGPKESRRGARGQPHTRAAQPRPWPRPLCVRRPWQPPNDAPLPISILPTENPRGVGNFPEQFRSSAAAADKFWGIEVSVPAPCRDGEVPPEPSPSAPSPSPPSPSTSPPSPSTLLSPMMRRE